MKTVLLRSTLALIAFALSASSLSFAADSVSELPEQMKGVGIDEHLGGSVSINDLTFRDEQGKSVHLGDYFKSGRPVILNLVYFNCPNLCTLVLNGMVKTMSQLDWVPGHQYDIVSVSINPKETPELAAQKKAAYVKMYVNKGGNPQAAEGWHFLTGQEDQIQKLAAEVGFKYRWDPETQQYAHTTAIYTLTPAGKISRYLYGTNFFPQDFKLSLLEASNGKIGSISDRFLLFCYRYNSKTKKYSVALFNVMQAGGAGTVLIFGGYLTAFWNKQRRVKPESEKEV